MAGFPPVLGLKQTEVSSTAEFTGKRNLSKWTEACLAYTQNCWKPRLWPGKEWSAECLLSRIKKNQVRSEARVKEDLKVTLELRKYVVKINQFFSFLIDGSQSI